MQLEIIILSEVSQKEKDKYWYLCYISDSTYMQNVTHGTNEPIIKQKEASDIENWLVVAKGERGRERDGLQVWGW